jgi:hypothetical protein
MKTRKQGAHVPGFYHAIHVLPRRQAPKRRKRVSKQNLALDEKEAFKRNLKFSLLNQLKPGNSGTVIRVGKILIPDGLVSKLSRKFKLSSRFKEDNEILKKLDMPIKRLINNHDVCYIRRFFSRIQPPKKIKLFENNQVIHGPHFFVYKYVKANEVLQVDTND